MSKKLVAIAGNIGAGKSTLTSLLCKKMGCRPFYEVVVDANHYLEDFYKDKARYGFALQVFFLSKRFKHLQEAKKISENAIFDRSIFEDKFIFAQNLYNRKEFSERDWNNYCNLFSIMEPFFPKMNLIIYLSIPPEAAYKRIKERDRKEEKDMIPIEYLKQLDNLYTDWIEKIDFCPVLHIDAVKYDPRTNPKHLDEITNMVRDKLKWK
jgi:deoxyadenosine/deoxycytidine kinase